MEQTIGMGTAVSITACALLFAAVGPALAQIIRTRALLDSRRLNGTTSGDLALAVAPFPVQKSSWLS